MPLATDKQYVKTYGKLPWWRSVTHFKKLFVNSTRTSTAIKIKPEIFSQGPHSFASTQLDLPGDLQAKCRAWMLANVAQEDLSPLETQDDRFHVTVRYGLHDPDLREVEAALQGLGPIGIELGRVEQFEADEYDVLTLPIVEHENLLALRSALGELPHTDTHPEYRPHVTLAYVQKGMGKRLLGDASFLGDTVALDRLRYSDSKGQISWVSLLPKQYAGKPIEALKKGEVLEIGPEGKKGVWRSIGGSPIFIEVKKGESVPQAVKRETGGKISPAGAQGSDAVSDTDIARALEQYIGDEYLDINGAMRGTEGWEPTARTDKQIRVLSAAFSTPGHYETTPPPAQVFRGVFNEQVFDQMKSLKPGQTIGDKAFLSTSLDSSVAEEVGRISGALGKGMVVLSIDLPKGARYLKGKTEEKELIFRHGSMLKITKVGQVDKQGRLNITARMVPLKTYAQEQDGEVLWVPLSPPWDGDKRVDLSDSESVKRQIQQIIQEHPDWDKNQIKAVLKGEEVPSASPKQYAGKPIEALKKGEVLEIGPEGKKGVWRSIGGSPIFIEVQKGESVPDAVKRETGGKVGVKRTQGPIFDSSTPSVDEVVKQFGPYDDEEVRESIKQFAAVDDSQFSRSLTPYERKVDFKAINSETTKLSSQGRQRVQALLAQSRDKLLALIASRHKAGTLTTKFALELELRGLGQLVPTLREVLGAGFRLGQREAKKELKHTFAAYGADFDEEEHPREEDGKFAPKGGGEGGGKGKSTAAKSRYEISGGDAKEEEGKGVSWKRAWDDIPVGQDYVLLPDESKIQVAMDSFGPYSEENAERIFYDLHGRQEALDALIDTHISVPRGGLDYLKNPLTTYLDPDPDYPGPRAVELLSVASRQAIERVAYTRWMESEGGKNTTITLYRGIAKVDSLKARTEKDVFPIQSWTSNPKKAMKFAGKKGIVIKAEVPISRLLLSIKSSGHLYGRNEWEYLILDKGLKPKILKYSAYSDKVYQVKLDPTGLPPEKALEFFERKAVLWGADIRQPLLGEIKGILFDGIKQGTPLRELMVRIEHAYLPWLGDPDQMIEEIMLTPYRLETLVRTNVNEALNEGRKAQFQDAVDDGFVIGLVFSAVLDARTTEVCKHLDEKVFPANSPDLDRLTPPRHFSCRSLLVPVTRLEGPVQYITQAQVAKGIELSGKGFSEEGESRVYASDFDEGEHPREDDGKFAPKGSGEASNAKSEDAIRAVGSGKDRTFVNADGSPVDAATQERINALGIPPAWTNVQVSADPESPLQAIGYDASGKEQPRYSVEHTGEANAAKHARCALLVQDGSYKAMVKGVASDTGKGVEEAVVMRLVVATAMRIGGDSEKAVGATTLEAQHLSVKGNDVQFDFPGKSGKRWEGTISDSALAKQISQRLAGKSGADRVFNTSAGKVNAYLKQYGKMSAKDVRTIQGTAVAHKALKELGVPKTLKEAKQFIKITATRVSEHLKNTLAVAKSSYIHPAIWVPIQAQFGIPAAK